MTYRLFGLLVLPFMLACGGSAYKNYEADYDYASGADRSRSSGGGGYGGAPAAAPPPTVTTEAEYAMDAPAADMGDDDYWDDEVEAEMARPDGELVSGEASPRNQPAPARGNTPAKSRPEPPNDAKPEAMGKESKPPVEKAGETSGRPAERLIIYTADVSIHVFDVEKTLKTITEHTKKLGGWIQQSTSSSLVIRVPVEHFAGLLEAIEAEGDVISKNVVGQDVTEEFFDLQIRLKNLEALRDRYKELLAQARKLEDSLAIEKELGRINGQIEQLKGRLKFLRSYVSNSTITVYVTRKPDEPVEVRRVPLPFHWLQRYSLDNVLR